MFLFDITREFDAACEGILVYNAKVPEPDVLSFVRQHERRPLVLDNLCHQVVLYERKLGAKANVVERNRIINYVAQMFIDAVKLKQQQELWSYCRRLEEERKANRLNDANHLIREVDNATGTTKEILQS